MSSQCPRQTAARSPDASVTTTTGESGQCGTAQPVMAAAPAGGAQKVHERGRTGLDHHQRDGRARGRIRRSAA